MIQIPIDFYEPRLDYKLSKEKKKEILQLLSKPNQLRTEKEFLEIKFKLEIACGSGDIDFIKILLSQKIEMNSEGLSFKINKVNKTASLIFVNKEMENLFIPRSIKYQNNEYLITSIVGFGYNQYSKKIKTISFDKNSAVTTIFSKAFDELNIEQINFPNSLKELKNKWCANTAYLKRITIPQKNNRFIFKDDKYLLGKTDVKSKDFDILLFAARNIEEAYIFPNIKVISPFAFGKCFNLQKIEIPPNSQLQTIKQFAFSKSRIKQIFIPSTLLIIEKYAFEYCKELSKVEFQKNSNLELIENGAFDSIRITDIYIPSKVSRICSKAFDNCVYLEKIEFQSNSKLQVIDPLVFTRSGIKKFPLSPNIIKICSSAFACCTDLRQFEIPKDSKLETIENDAFSNTKIEELYFPVNLNELKEGWCNYLEKLTKFVISPSNHRFIFKDNQYLLGKTDDNSDNFDILLFGQRNIEEAIITPNVLIITACAFQLCRNLRKIEIPLNSNLLAIEKNAFEDSKIEQINIPSNVSKIGEFAFSRCRNLRKVVIQKDSKLRVIERYSFNLTSIESIFIPSNVSMINEYSFHGCQKLRNVVILPDSMLTTIGDNAFERSGIECFYIPQKVSKICKYAFFYCKKLQIIEISEYSEIEYIDSTSFSGCPNLIIMKACY